MTTNRSFALLCAAVLSSGIATSAQAGAFIFTNNAGLEDFIFHPMNYNGTGGVLINRVCLDTSLLPSGVSANTVEATLLKAIRSWNRNRGVTNNLNLVTNNDLPALGNFDFESALTHELGHCTTLAHPNLASESGLSSPTNNATQAQRGSNGSFDTNAGVDGNPGSADDVRGDDINRYWFVPASNDPMDLPGVVDASSVSRDVADLTGGSIWPANGDRTVLAALGYSNTESVMQQQQSNAEVQRRPTPEDIRQLRLGMAGVDRTAGTGDDYTLELLYVGQGVPASCDITVGFSASTAFAACSTGGGTFTGTSSGVITSAAVTMSPTINWYFSQIENTTTSVTSTSPSSPNLGESVTVNVSVSRDSVLMSGTPSGTFEVELNGEICTGTLSGGTGSCAVTATVSGAQTINASYYGFEGFDASESTSNITIGLPTPTVAITSDAPDPSEVGESFTVNVSVTGSLGTPTGTVTVSDGSDSCVTGNLSGGSASCSLASTTAGNKTLTATYGGDNNFNGAQDTEPHTVVATAPTVTITSDDPDPSSVGQGYSVAVQVTGPGATPTGTVNVSDGGASSCSMTLSGGSGNCALTSTSAGALTLTASYLGDANYSSASDTEPHTVAPATPTVTIVSDVPDPSGVGELYNVLVTVLSPFGSPTGTVNISDGEVSCTTGALAAGTASCALASVTAGAKTLTATYAGDGNFNGGSDTEPHQVTAGDPDVTITSDTPDPSALGQSYTVAVTVTGDGVMPEGTVEVDNTESICQITLNNGSGSCSVTSDTAGNKVLTANYLGDGNYGAASSTENHTVSQGQPTVTITGDAPDPSEVGETYQVDVSVSGDGIPPTGSVTVTDGSGLCNVTLVNGSGSCDLSSFTAGALTLTADYAGDSNYVTASDTEPHTVTRTTPVISITNQSPNPSTVGEAYAVTVSVTSASGTPTGTVTIDDGTVNCTTGNLSGGTASCNLSSTTAGSKTLTATYAGDSNFSSTSSTAIQTVNPADPTVSITGDTPDPSGLGAPYTVAVSVTGDGASPTGTVNINDGLDDCDATLTGGSGSCQITSSTAGNKTLTATYAGDANYNGGSSTEDHVVSQGTPMVSITSDLPDPSDLGADYTVQVTIRGDGVDPTGSVTVSDPDGNCQITLVNGAGSCALNGQSAGPRTITADYGGDSNYLSGSDTESHTVSTGAAVVDLVSANPSPSDLGQPYTASVTVSGDGETPSGSVTIDDGLDDCEITLAAGAGSCALTSSTAGNKTLTASYAGDGNYSAASDTLAHTVNRIAATVTITASNPNPSVFGQTVQVEVSVTSPEGTPSGTVTISDGDVQCTTPALQGGSASCNLTPASAGEKTLTATYAGDDNFTSGQGSGSHIVQPAPTTVTITGSVPNPSLVNQAYDVTVSVSSTQGDPSGTVEISNEEDSCVTADVNGGTASCSLVSTTAGEKALTAVYAGDGNFDTAQDTAPHTVSAEPPEDDVFEDRFEAPAADRPDDPNER
ncbi:MAG: Ig-like domain-containing protein [Pseudomonadota bacterium]